MNMRVLADTERASVYEVQKFEKRISSTQKKLLERADQGTFYKNEEYLAEGRIQRYEDNCFCGYFELLCDEDGDYRITHISEGAAKMFQRPKEELLENPYRYVLAEDLPVLFSKNAQAHIEQKHSVIEYRILTPNNKVKWIRAQSAPVDTHKLSEATKQGINHHQSRQLWHGILTDITEIKKLQLELEKQAFSDSLTGIYNHREFWRIMDARQSIFQDTGRSMGLLLCDFNNFKKINDEYGHSVGDMLLQHFVKKVSKILPINTRFARIGGDEFGILVFTDSQIELESLKVSIMEQVCRNPFIFQENLMMIKFKVSIGVARYLDKNATAKALYKAADAELYKHKQQFL
jgi:diguanylate cyclase (GGDEF)-like protein